MKKKYQVFISSTFTDLKVERFEVMQALLKYGSLPASMELFTASNDSQWDIIKKVINESDYYLIIIGGKYGSVHPERGISYTQMEYEYAVEIGKPILRFIVQDLSKLPQDKVERDIGLEKKLSDFRNLLMKNNLCQFYESPKELALAVSLAMNNLINDHPSPGWIRSSDYSSPQTVKDFDDVKTIKEKTIYYKILNLKSIDENAEPIYEKYIPRIKKKIKVVSEYLSIRVIKFDSPVNSFKGRDRTNGSALELRSLFPFLQNLEDADNRSPNFIEPLINIESDIYINIGHTYNGFKEGDLDLGMKAEKNIENARLIIDMSSIPNFSSILPNQPMLFNSRFVQHQDGKVENLESVFLENYEIIANGVFMAEVKNMRKDEGLRFEFSTDIETSSNNL